MADAIPYPPTPEDVPDDLTDRPPELVRKEWFLLVGLMVFLALYLSAVMLFGFATLWCVVNLGRYHIFAALGFVFFGLTFLMLAKNLFRHFEPEFEEFKIELKERDQPRLHAFVRRICAETGADEPRRIWVIPDVNASAVCPVRLKHLFVHPRYELCLGLGLINCLNLSEFKAVVAHELGHFTQGGFVDNYVMSVRAIIGNICNGRDWFDTFVEWLKNSGAPLAVLGFTLGGMLWVLRGATLGLYHVIGRTEFELARANEFHADLVSASLAGSDAAVQGLFKSKHGDDFFGFALDELRRAADHKLYTADLYFHQHALADLYRRKKKEPKKGIPPKLDGPQAGRKIQVFDPDDEADGDPDDYHPSGYEREENIKNEFIEAPIDERTPWVLFDEPASVREKMTQRYYRVVYNVGKSATAADPRTVQKFIDEENAETTYDPKYDGSYDDRIIDPGDLDELNELIQKEPWPDDRLIAVYEKLYSDVGKRSESRAELVKEYDALVETGGARGRKARKLLKELETKLEKADEWFHSLDRRVYLVFVQMAYRVRDDYYYELINRYRFQLAIQNFYKSARKHGSLAFVTINLHSGGGPIAEDDFVELMHVLREARSALRKILRDAKELDLPAMKHFEEGDRLADFLLDEEIVKELPETYVKGKWLDKLLRQLGQVMNRTSRLHGKSLGGILKLQEEIASQFQARKVPPIATAAVEEPLAPIFEDDPPAT
jgi:Zn-dependent protease with chaperone function